MNIFEFLQKEHELVANAPLIYGDVFASTNRILDYFGQCFHATDEKALYSSVFIVEVQKSLYLSAVSAMRHHRVQMFHMLRNALESEVLACYALSCPDNSVFADMNDGYLKPKEALKKGGYSWFGDKYAESSEKIESFKGMINKNFAHANIFGATQNLMVDDEKKRVDPSLFDATEKKEVERNLWMIGDTAIGCMRIYAAVVKNYPLVRVDPHFLNNVNELFLESERIKERLAKGFDPEILKASREGQA